MGMDHLSQLALGSSDGHDNELDLLICPRLSDPSAGLSMAFPVNNQFNGPFTLMLNSELSSFYDDFDPHTTNLVTNYDITASNDNSITSSNFNLSDFNTSHTFDSHASISTTAQIIPCDIVPAVHNESGGITHWASNMPPLPTPLIYSPSPTPSPPIMVNHVPKKRPRVEVDVQDILPTGSRRVKVKSARARQMDMDYDI